MNPIEIIEKKRDGFALSEEELQYVVDGASGKVEFEPYQLSALLMAIYLKGLDARETGTLTVQMAHSGDMLDLSAIEGIKVDKHSTGGVADTTTLVLAPLLAACGVKVAKMSGRGLGHTGGTVDKLEAIPGMRVDLAPDEFVGIVNRVGCAVAGQTAKLAPADKTLYHLRDVTGTVPSMPLIVASILSKKIASGCDVVTLDVKTGSGALMPTIEKSIELARCMVEIGTHTGRRFSALVTDMNQPLGRFVGNALEVEEAIRLLRGEEKGDLLEVSLALGEQILTQSGIDAPRARLERALSGGEGLERLRRMIEAQGGDARVCDDVSRLPRARQTIPVCAPHAGYVGAFDTLQIGMASRDLGAGRIYASDVIDPAVGIVMQKRLGDWVEKGEPLYEVHANPASHAEEAVRRLCHAVTLSDERPAKVPLIHAVIEP